MEKAQRARGLKMGTAEEKGKEQVNRPDRKKAEKKADVNR